MFELYFDCTEERRDEEETLNARYSTEMNQRRDPINCTLE